ARRAAAVRRQGAVADRQQAQGRDRRARVQAGDQGTARAGGDRDRAARRAVTRRGVGKNIRKRASPRGARDLLRFRKVRHALTEKRTYSAGKLLAARAPGIRATEERVRRSTQTGLSPPSPLSQHRKSGWNGLRDRG